MSSPIPWTRAQEPDRQSGQMPARGSSRKADPGPIQEPTPGPIQEPTPGAGRPLRILIAPDSFKGSLSSVAVAEALAEGWARARPDDPVIRTPLADGGEGTLAALAAAGGWRWEAAMVHDPLGRVRRARWLRSADGRRAAVEMAEASGLSLLAADERDPWRATTSGTGELLRAALNAGVEEILLGIGGSATTDGGRGLLEALGVAADDRGRVDLGGLDPRLARVTLRVACDVRNPLLGPEGAAAVYGPQKGATPEMVPRLEARLAAWADALEAAAGRRERETPGAGAAGGVGFALLCLTDRVGRLEFRPGVELVMEAVDLEGRLETADLVLTGEGRIDGQTAFGKTVLGVARLAAAHRRPCIAVGGGVTPEGSAALAPLGAVAVPVVEAPQTVAEAMAAGADPLRRCGERLARLVGIGLRLAGVLNELPHGLPGGRSPQSD
jgi:glycerate kinase